MKLETWKGLALLLSLSYLIAITAGVILCNIKTCSQAYLSGRILETLWFLSTIAWMLIRGKRRKENTE